MTSPGIEPATFRLVFNQLRHRVHILVVQSRNPVRQPITSHFLWFFSVSPCHYSTLLVHKSSDVSLQLPYSPLRPASFRTQSTLYHQNKAQFFLVRLAMGWTVRGSNPGVGEFSAPVQTGPGSNPASCAMGTGSLSRG
jgi:hypothetical protein